MERHQALKRHSSRTLFTHNKRNQWLTLLKVTNEHIFDRKSEYKILKIPHQVL